MGHLASIEDRRDAYRVLVGRPEGKGPLGRPRYRRVANASKASKLVKRQISWARYRHKKFNILGGKTEVKSRIVSCRMEVITVRFICQHML